MSAQVAMLTADAEAVYQAVGAASTCWSPMDGTGVFESRRAETIAQEILALVEPPGVEPVEYRAVDVSGREWRREPGGTWAAVEAIPAHRIGHGDA